MEIDLRKSKRGRPRSVDLRFTSSSLEEVYQLGEVLGRLNESNVEVFEFRDNDEGLFGLTVSLRTLDETEGVDEEDEEDFEDEEDVIETSPKGPKKKRKRFQG